jgi:ribosomal protein S24E
MITIAFYVVYFKIKRLKKEFGEYQTKTNLKLDLTMQKMDLFEKTGKVETLNQDEIIEVSFDNSILDRRFFYNRLHFIIQI